MQDKLQVILKKHMEESKDTCKVIDEVIPWENQEVDSDNIIIIATS